MATPRWKPCADAVVLLPRGLAALAAACTGRTMTARRLLRADRGPAAPLLAAHAVLTVLLGALAWVLAGVLALAVTRGPFYGLVADGPYDDAWGGPTLAGAWLAHFAVSVPLAAVATTLLYGLTCLHHRTTGPLRGVRRPRWALPVALLSGVAGALFVVAFLHQLD
jgi:hypothetical protein